MTAIKGLVLAVIPILLMTLWYKDVKIDKLKAELDKSAFMLDRQTAEIEKLKKDTKKFNEEIFPEKKKEALAKYDLEQNLNKMSEEVTKAYETLEVCLNELNKVRGLVKTWYH